MDGHAIIPEGIEAGHALPIIIAADARAKLHPHSGSLDLDFREQIIVFMDQANDVICQTVQENNPQELRDSIEKILDDLQEDFTRYKNPDETPVAETTNPPAHELLRPMIEQLNGLAGLMTGNKEIQIQIQNMIAQLKININTISQNCWILKFSRSQLPRFMEKSREILNKAGKILFKELTERIRDKSKDSPDKYDCITKIIDGFKSCCYLELEVKVTDLLEPKPENREVVVRILGSWEIKKTASEEENLDQFIQTLSEQGKRLQPNLEPILRGLHNTGENVQMSTQSTSRKRPIQAEEIEVESSSPIKRRRKDSDEVGSSSSLIKEEVREGIRQHMPQTLHAKDEHEPICTIWDDEKRREKMLKDLLEKNLLLRKIVELCDESDTFNLILPSILERCENWSLEYEHKYKPVQRNRNEEFYAERIRRYIQEKLQVDPNMMMSSPLSKAEILFYLLNSDKGADNPVMALLCRIWKPLHSDAIHNVYELTCFLFSDDQIFDHFYHLLDQNWKALDHVLKKNIKEFILNDQSHFLVEQLLRTTEVGSTSTSASTMHSYPLENLRWLLTETRDPTRLSQATHLFQTPTFEPYIKIFKEEHVKSLYSLLAFENSKKQTALHTNANCIAWIIIHTYVPRYRNDIEELLAKMDPSEGTPVNNKKQGSPNVLIIASESGKADALSRDFKEAGMNVYNVYKYEPLQTDKQQMEEIVVHIKRIFEQNDTPPSGLFVVFLATGVKEGTRNNQLRQIERAMCESKANEGRCIPKILITDCEAATYRPTHKHFCAILFSGRGSAKNQLDHEPADFLEKFVRLLGADRPGLSLESLFNTASSQMSNEDGSLTPIMLSKLASDYYPLRGGLSASVSSSTQIQDVGLLSWTREQVSKNRYIMHDNPTVLIIYTTHDRPGAEKEASSLSDAFESTNRYKIKIQPDKPVKKILQFIEESATETDKYSNMQPSALIVIIMSRGNFSHRNLEDCDKESFNVDSVMKAMCQENLTDRPKILITQFTQTKDEEEYGNHLEIPPESFVTLASFTGENASQKSFINELAEQIRLSSRGEDLNKIIVNARKNQKQAVPFIQDLKGVFIPGIRIPLHKSE